MCVCRLEARLNALLHCWQMYGLEVVWVSWWRDRLPSCLKARPHCWQTKGLSPVWIRLCVIRVLERVNDRPHSSHTCLDLDFGQRLWSCAVISFCPRTITAAGKYAVWTEPKASISSKLLISLASKPTDRPSSHGISFGISSSRLFLFLMDKLSVNRLFSPFPWSSFSALSESVSCGSDGGSQQMLEMLGLVPISSLQLRCCAWWKPCTDRLSSVSDDLSWKCAWRSSSCFTDTAVSFSNLCWKETELNNGIGGWMTLLLRHNPPCGSLKEILRL